MPNGALKLMVFIFYERQLQKKKAATRPIATLFHFFDDERCDRELLFVSTFFSLAVKNRREEEGITRNSNSK